MPDVTISNLPTRAPVATDIIPCSTGTETYRASISQINSLASGTPTGTVIMWATATPPAGYLECNGAAISRTTNAALFSVLGTTYGAGDGSTTFNLPDLRGEFIRGWDNSRGVDSGRAIGSSQADDFRSHVHGANGGPNGTNYGPYIKVSNEYGGGGSTTSSGGTETRPRNVALMYCIKT